MQRCAFPGIRLEQRQGVSAVVQVGVEHVDLGAEAPVDLHQRVQQDGLADPLTWSVAPATRSPMPATYDNVLYRM